MTTYAATPEHIADFLELLRALEKDITSTSPGIASKLDGLTSGIRAFRILQRLSGRSSGALRSSRSPASSAGYKRISAKNPRWRLLLIEDGDLIYGNFLFADKRRILALPAKPSTTPTRCPASIRTGPSFSTALNRRPHPAASHGPDLSAARRTRRGHPPADHREDPA